MIELLRTKEVLTNAKSNSQYWNCLRENLKIGHSTKVDPRITKKKPCS